MKKVYYEKVGNRYKAISEYDSEWTHSFTQGTHVVVVEKPGVTSYIYDIDPDYAAMIAAGMVAEDVISEAIMKATELRRNTRNRDNTPLTPEQHLAWEHLVEVFGDDAKQLEWPSAREAAKEAVDVMRMEAERLLNVPSVRKAYEQFLLVAALTKDENEPKS